MGYPILEGMAGLVISLLIIRVGLGLSWNSLLVLMDAVENPDTLMDVIRLSENVHGVVEARGVRMRRSGPFCMGEVTIRVSENLSVDKAHRLSHLVEEAVKRGVPKVESLVVHIEPVERQKNRVGLPVKSDEGLDLLKLGQSRLDKIVRDFVCTPDPLKERYRMEKVVWDTYYNVLDKVEDGLKKDDPFALELRKKAKKLIEDCKLEVDV